MKRKREAINSSLFPDFTLEFLKEKPDSQQLPEVQQLH
jgi:hypothetical protein